MATKTRKIPQSHWDEHRDTILDLYLDRNFSMRKLIDTMHHDHGFTATISQFEAQLRVWGAHKNVGIREWERIFGKIDSLASSGVESRVLISGRLVSMKKILRARRYYQAKNDPGKRSRVESGSPDQTTSNNNPSDVVIEIQDSSGQWSRYTTPIDEDVAPNQQQTLPSMQERGHDGLSPLVQSFIPNLIHENLIPANGNENSAQPLDFSLVTYETQEVPQLFAQTGAFMDNADLYTDNTMHSLDLFPSPAQYLPAASHLNGLLFEQFERDLALKRLQLAAYPSPMQVESGLFYGVYGLACKFADEAATIMTQTNKKSFHENYDIIRLKLHTLESVLPKFQRGGSSQITREVELHRLLLYSSANGFVGLDGVPIEAVFRFLNQGSNTTLLLSRLFQENPGHVAKSLAENLFRAAIESDDHIIIRFFLKAGLVDVDRTFFIVDGEKYTPLERAAERQRLKAIKELIRFEPEVNKTFFIRSDSDGPVVGVLGLLIVGRYSDDRIRRTFSPFSSEYLETVDLLIEAGVKIHYSSIRRALIRFSRMDLAKKLLRRLPSSDHSKAFGIINITEAGMSNMERVANEFTDEEATEVVTKVLSDCEQTDCKNCPSQFSTQLSQTVAIGAKRGYIRLVRSLFQHAKSPTQILSMAIKSGNHELIDFVLVQKPDVCRAVPTVHPEFGCLSYTTPLAEAIEAGDDVLIRRFEREGALKDIESHDHPEDSALARRGIANTRFTSVITAASKVGNFEYVRKLLSQQPRATQLETENALLSAIKFRQESVVHQLLDLGTNYTSPSQTDFIIEAYKWGNQSILASLMSAFPDVEVISFDDDHVDENILEFFYSLGRVTWGALNEYLEIAIARDDSVLLSRLLEWGADAIEGLTAAVDGHNDMLRILLEHIPPFKMPFKSFGTNAVSKAITQLPNNIEALELLLACKAVDWKSLGPYRSTARGGEYGPSPLGLAIRRDASSSCLEFPLTTRLLDVGCNVDQIVAIEEDSKGLQIKRTAILIAIQITSIRMVEFLICRGADVNKEAVYGIHRTPLQAAAECGSLALVELLLKGGANVNGKPASHQGATALQCAAMSGNCNIAALLLDNGALLYDPPSAFDGRTPIQGAAEHGRIDMIQFLWNTSQGYGFLAEDCRKAMELAEENGHMACKDLILELAVKTGNISMIEMFG